MILANDALGVHTSLMDRILYDSHMHTPFCGHAVGNPDEYARAAVTAGLKGITFTCHNPVPKWRDLNQRMKVVELPRYVEIITALREAWIDELEIQLGLECDFFPGLEGYLKELLDQSPFGYLLGSVHPWVSEYQDRFGDADTEKMQRLYFDHLALSAESGFFDCLSHPDIVKLLEPAAWQPLKIWDSIEAALDRIAATGVAMEVNTSGLIKAIPEINPGIEMLKAMQARDIPVVLGSDAHCPDRVAADFGFALELLSRVGYRRVCYFINRQQRWCNITEALSSLPRVHASA